MSIPILFYAGFRREQRSIKSTQQIISRIFKWKDTNSPAQLGPYLSEIR